MYCRLIVVSAMLLVCGIGRAESAPPTPYYLALGDSLAVSIQPNASGDLVETTQGYVEDLYALLRLRRPNLQLAKLGCSGETTTSMVGGGVCEYQSAASQLAAAVEFIKTHRVVLITLSIGGHNVLRCVDPNTGIFDLDCVGLGLSAIPPDMVQILGDLRTAAGPSVPIVGMNYYDPFLAAWTLGPDGQVLAKDSLKVTNLLNLGLRGAYSFFNVPVADVARAFRINDFTPVPFFNLPLNVLLELRWTWIGASPPDIHPNATGYAVIALAFLKAIGI